MLAPLVDLALSSGSDVRYLADIVSDGTNNNIVLTAVRTILAIATVVLVGAFGVNVVKHYLKDGKDWKSTLNEARGLVVAQALLAVVWGLVEVGASLGVGIVPS